MNRQGRSFLPGRSQWLPFWAGFVLAFPVCEIAAQTIPDTSPVDFATQIRPILSENCFFCHGQDSEARQAELRLDIESGLNRTVTPGQPDRSLLIARIESSEPDMVMPPPDSNRELSVTQRQLVRRWIAEGGRWSGHWSFQPIAAPRVPDASFPDQVPVRNSIDRFLQQKQRSAGLKPATEADRPMLIRRVTLDLTGLPPSPLEVRRFVEDQDPRAFERLVDRLLESPAYGERMAWNWLDAARYADSNGYQGDRERTMWPWRDWVVRAFNSNLPYDTFTVWQIAGDLLPDASFDQQLATGFLRNHMINGEGGRIPEENRVDYVFDMSETVGTVWLGLTLNCCRCHDHKYDPMTRRDYYGMFAFFNQTPVSGGGGDPQTKPVLAVPNEQQRDRMQQLGRVVSESDRTLESLKTQRLKNQSKWEARLLDSLADDSWIPLQPETWSADVQELKLLDDGSLLAGGQEAVQDNYTVVFRPKRPTVFGSLRLEALRHQSLGRNSLARSDSGNFVLTHATIRIKSADHAGQNLKITSGEATFEQGSLGIANVWDNDPASGWAVYEGRLVDRDHACILRLSEPVTLTEGDRVEVRLEHQSRHRFHNLGRFRMAVHPNPMARLNNRNETLRSALLVPKADRDAKQNQLVTAAILADDREYASVRERREARQKELDALVNSLPKVMVMADLETPRKTYLLERGLYTSRGAEVTASVPAHLPSLPDTATGNRLDLARWLVDPANPLTARVTVNRFWQQVFGVGLVKTTEDFGVQGEIPPHRELLDWLAHDFRNHGWNVKRLMRMMVTSHAYRQTSRVPAALYEADPENRLVARGPRRRLESWIIRDSVLQASGLLIDRVGGAPVNGYQPANVWEEATFGKKTYRQQHGDALYRRSLYTFWRRIIAPTMFFDVASRQTCVVKTGQTNTPLHALMTLNDVQYVEAARHLAQGLLHQRGTDDRKRIDQLYMRLLSRSPQAAEFAVLTEALRRSRDEYKAEPELAKKLLTVGESPRDTTIDAVEHASWTALCLAVMNLDETLTRE